MLNFIHLWGFVKESKSSSADITSSYKKGCIIKTKPTAGLQASILLLMKNASYVYFVQEEMIKIIICTLNRIKNISVVNTKCDYFVRVSVNINSQVLAQQVIQSIFLAQAGLSFSKVLRC